MTVFVLKIIACITMLTDHIGYIFFPGVYFLRFIGRTAFPIYCFLIAEGYRHTGSFRAYLGRLVLFSVLSEVFFDLAFSGVPLDMSDQNVYFTLACGLVCIWCTDHLERFLSKNGRESHRLLLSPAVIVFFCLAARFLKSDYDAVGIVYIMTFYYAGRMKKDHPARAAVFTLLVFSAVFLLMPVKIHGPLEPDRYLFYMKAAYWVYAGTFIPLVLLHFYNGLPGYRSKATKWAFYLFYPLHLLALYLIHLNISPG